MIFKFVLPRIFFIRRLAFVLVLSSALFGLVTVSNFRTSRALPPVSETIVVKAQGPTASPSPNPQVKVLASKEQAELSPDPSSSPASGVVNSKKNPLCVGVSEQWKMVPEPGKEGLYVICNAVEEKLGTSSELNTVLNNYRTAHGLSALSVNSGLCKVAEGRAHEIAGNFDHDGFEAAVKASGVSAHALGENIASGSLSATKFVEWSWDRSPGHKANMLGDWSDGCGVIWNSYAVFIFAKL